MLTAELSNRGRYMYLFYIQAEKHIPVPITSGKDRKGDLVSSTCHMYCCTDYISSPSLSSILRDRVTTAHYNTCLVLHTLKERNAMKKPQAAWYVCMYIYI